MSPSGSVSESNVEPSEVRGHRELRPPTLEQGRVAPQDRVAMQDRVEDLLVAPGTRILHIGPHKTGTTALQGAFHAARDRLAEHGVVYAGEHRQPVAAASYIAGVRGLRGTRIPRLEHWEDLCEQVAKADARRVVISSEYFSNADDERAAMAVDGLNGDSQTTRVHVVVTLRRLLRIMPSQWQQFVQNGVQESYPKWLEVVLNRSADEQPNPFLWLRHDHGALVERWAGLVGPDNLTVIVVDESDHGSVLRGFESLVGLPTGFLIAPVDGTNRSLTAGEAELVRAMNHEYHQRGWSEDRYHKELRQGAVRRILRRPPALAEHGIRTPRWAADRIVDLNTEMAERIAALGVRVSGDLSVLSRPAVEADVVPEGETADETGPVPAMLPAATAAEALTGAVLAARSTAQKAAQKARKQGPDTAERPQAEARRTVPAPTGADTTEQRCRQSRASAPPGSPARTITVPVGQRPANSVRSIELVGLLGRRLRRRIRRRIAAGIGRRDGDRDEDRTH